MFQNHRHTIRFSVFAGFMIIAVCVGLGITHQNVMRTDMKVMAEQNNIALTRALSNDIWPSYSTFVETARFLDAQILRQHQKTTELRARILTQMQGISILKVKIYDKTGLTVFSTEPTQIGEIKGDSPGYYAALAGQVTSQGSHREQFQGFGELFEDRELIESYVPIFGPDQKVQGIFEVYYDVTELMGQIHHSFLVQASLVGVAFFTLYLFLLFVVWRSEQDSRRQHRANIALIRATAAAEAESRSKSEILANMSHEFRTPLNAIIGFSETMQLEVFGPVGTPKYQEYIQDILNSGRHLLAVVNDVLNMSKAESGKIDLDDSDFEIVDVVMDGFKLLEDCAKRRGVSIRHELSAELPLVRGDELRVKQVLINCLSNAVKYTAEGGVVTVRAQIVANGDLKLCITDTGVGMSEENIKLALTPFGRVESSYTSSVGGTGLGLPLAKTYMEMHGGKLKLKSILGEGTILSLILPKERLNYVHPESEIRIAG